MDTIIKSGEKFVTPERYAELKGIAVSTVYYRISQGQVETTRAFKKTFVKE